MSLAREGQRPLGDFVQEENCVCGFVVDEYDDGRYAIEYADPDTGLVIGRCPDCGRELNLRGQTPRPALSEEQRP